MAKKITCPAPAKINHFLHVTGKRDDGYHFIQTLFQFIDFNDELTFTMDSTLSLKQLSSTYIIPDTDNLIVRAAQLLQQHTGCQLGATITMDKHIPIGGGLGSGSSNAATTLLPLNQLWALKLSDHELMTLGRQLGADVPIFIHGHTAFAQGIGDELHSTSTPEQWCVLIIPRKTQVLTQKAFNNPDLPRNTPAITPHQYQSGYGHNDFEALIRSAYPEIDHAMHWLSQYGQAKLSGTGSCVFTTFDTEKKAGRIAELAACEFDVILARTMNQSSAKITLCHN